MFSKPNSLSAGVLRGHKAPLDAGGLRSYRATGKENRSVVFQWAGQRYDEIKPTLGELERLEEFFRQKQEAE